MSVEQEPLHTSLQRDNRENSNATTASGMDTVLGRMGALDIITIASSDPLPVVEERYRNAIVAMVINRSKEPLQLYHWIPAADYVPEARKPKKPVVRITVNDREQIGVPMENYFPKKGSTLMIRDAQGDIPLLQILRTLQERPGHTVTMFRGELTYNNTIRKPSASMRRKLPITTESSNAIRRKRGRKAESTGHDGKHVREPEIPLGIQLFYKLPREDQQKILDYMDVKLRGHMRRILYEDSAGLHSRSASELDMHASTLRGRLIRISRYVSEWIDISDEGQVSRRLSETEHFHHAMRRHSSGNMTDLPLAQPGYKKDKKTRRRRKGWH